jgi:hypothetical protein
MYADKDSNGGKGMHKGLDEDKSFMYEFKGKLVRNSPPLSLLSHRIIVAVVRVELKTI